MVPERHRLATGGVLIVGYQKEDDVLHFKLRNRWGTEAADDGCSYVSWTVLLPNIYFIKTFE